MKILVTGALGHIGSRLIRHLPNVKDVDFIRIFDNLSTQRYCSLFNLPNNIPFEFIEGDIRKMDEIVGATKDIDILFHLAAITDAPSTIDMPELTEQVNLRGTRNVVEACIQNGVRRIIYPSTTSVYGPCVGNVTEEWPNCRPASPYAKFKLLGENEVINASKNGRLEGTVLRLGTIYGTSIGMRFHTAVNKFVFQSCMGQPITVWDNALDQERPYLDLSDCMRAMEFMLEIGRGTSQVYNVLTHNSTVRQILDSIKLYVPDAKVTFTKSPILNQTSYHVDDSKIRKIGFVPNGNLVKAVGETVGLLKSFRVNKK